MTDCEDEEIEITTTTPHSKEYLYAKSLFDCKEYLKASFVLRDVDHHDYLSRFLFFYSKYLSIKESSAFRDETMPQDVDLQMIDLKQEMSGIPMDAYLLYLYGAICTQVDCKLEGKQALMESLHLYPYNWSCWLALSEFVDKISIVADISNEFEDSFMLECWKVYVLNELHCSPEIVLPILDPLANIHPKNS